jgi:hypothetical protein
MRDIETEDESEFSYSNFTIEEDPANSLVSMLHQLDDLNDTLPFDLFSSPSEDEEEEDFEGVDTYNLEYHIDGLASQLGQMSDLGGGNISASFNLTSLMPSFFVDLPRRQGLERRIESARRRLAWIKNCRRPCELYAYAG